jgi:hypothetical protein
MKTIIIAIMSISLFGCSTILEKIPSRWDVNQAKVITDIQQQTRNFDCKGDQLAQLNHLSLNIEWFEIYAKTKPTRDVAKLTKTISDSVLEFKGRAQKGSVSPIYCDIKRKLFIQQANIIAGATQGRF